MEPVSTTAHPFGLSVYLNKDKGTCTRTILHRSRIRMSALVLWCALNHVATTTIQLDCCGVGGWGGGDSTAIHSDCANSCCPQQHNSHTPFPDGVINPLNFTDNEKKGPLHMYRTVIKFFKNPKTNFLSSVLNKIHIW